VRSKKEGAYLYHNPKALKKAFENSVGDRFGRVLSLKPTGLFPLVLKESKWLTKGAIVSIGAAAQALHPIAGQGLNLALRDASDLAKILMEKNFWNHQEEGLRRYQSHRRKDRLNTLLLTHGLAKWLKQPKMAWLTGLGLNGLDASSLLRRQFLSYMIFGVQNRRRGFERNTQKPII
jgi:2-octaprenyl-6-methoxyphenol hydroxylase